MYTHMYINLYIYIFYVHNHLLSKLFQPSNSEIHSVVVYFILLFHTFLLQVNNILKHDEITFSALPERGPEITGLSSHYAVGENVTANCTAWPSVPKASLHWTINGKSVKYIKATVQITPERNGG